VADDLLQASFDRHPPGPAVPPARSYAVCATPRSGSTLLSEGLRALGGLGTPMEYFNVEVNVTPLRQRWGSDSVEAFVRDLYRFRTSREGVFGMKLHWQQVEEMRTHLHLDRVAGGDGRVTDRAMLDTLFPGLRYVHVRRCDRDRQAVSYWIAEHTQQWSMHLGEEPSPAPAPEYDAAGIDALRHKIEHGEASWDGYFRDCGIDPVRVIYEELVDDYHGVVAHVASTLGFPRKAADVPPPRLRRQADERSEQLLARYQRDRAQRSPRVWSGAAG
jgi:LPS sulfotransferase NodH